jgi:capsular exopolysaccharide synthesis family protein
LVFSLRQHDTYSASAMVLLSHQDLGAQLTGTQGQSIDPTRDSSTQATLARIPAVAKLALANAHSNGAVGDFLANSSVNSNPTADILTFGYTAADPVTAARLATAYARAYVAYHRNSETQPITSAINEIQARIAQTPHGALYDSLVAQEQKLQELATLKTSDAVLVQKAGGARRNGSGTTKNVVLGLMIGLFLGIGLAFLREALDTRVRSADTVRERLGIPLLARLPRPPRKLRDRDQIVMMAEPAGVQAEAFRILRTNLEFAALGKDVGALMITSAAEQEGKSTTAANLAVAQALAGHRVVLVDLDLRRPYIDRFFGITGRPGLTDVAVGHVALDLALADISLPTPLFAVSGADVASNGKRTPQRGSLRVLASGPLPPDPGEFVATPRLQEIIEQLRSDSDIVLIDTPPLFHVGDALALSGHVDAMVLVTRMEILRRGMLNELRRLLEGVPCQRLGFVIAGAESDDAYAGTYPSYYYGRPPEQTATERSAAGRH